MTGAETLSALTDRVKGRAAFVPSNFNALLGANQGGDYMSCEHGNWPPCDECDALDVAWKKGYESAKKEALEEIANWTAGYGLLFAENAKLKELLDRIAEASPIYDKNGKSYFQDDLMNLWDAVYPYSVPNK